MVAFVAIVEHLIAQNDTIRIIRFAPAQSNRCFILNISSEISWTAWYCKWKNVHEVKPSKSKLTCCVITNKRHTVLFILIVLHFHA